MFKILKIVLINLILVFIIDLLFGVFFNTPKYLSKKNYNYGLYHSNYRDYFDEISFKGEKLYGINKNKIKTDLLRDIDIKYQGKKALILGDSFTFGQGVRKTDRYSNMLSRLSNDKIRSLNIAQSGYDIADVYYSLKTKDLTFKPDFIIYGFCLNDMPNYDANNKLDTDSDQKKKKNI
jgi:hypothetical protein